MGKREAYFPTRAVRYPTFIPEKITERRKRKERKEKLAEQLARLQKPLILPVKKKNKG